MRKLTLLWYNISLFPLALLVSSMCFGNDHIIAAAVGVCLLSVLVSFAGMFVRAKLRSAERKKAVAVYVSELVAGIILVTVLSKFDGPVPLVIYTYSMFMAGTYVYGNTLRETIKTPVLVLSMVLGVIIGASFTFIYEMNAAFMAVPMILSVILWIYLRNRRNLFIMMQTRNYDEKYLPQSMVKFNSKITFIIAAAAGIILSFYGQYSLTLVSLWRKISILIGTLLSKGELAGTTDISGNYDEGPDISHPDRHLAVPLSQTVCEILITVFAAAILIYLIKKGVFNGVFRGIVSFVRNIFAVRHTKVKIISDKGYTDSVEDISDDGSKQVNVRSERKKWNEQLKLFTGMKNGNEKLRFGYQLARSGIRFADSSVTSSLTPRETLAKISNSESFAGGYSSVRYGGSSAGDSECAEAEKVLLDVKSLMKNVKIKK